MSYIVHLFRGREASSSDPPSRTTPTSTRPHALLLDCNCLWRGCPSTGPLLLPLRLAKMEILQKWKSDAKARESKSLLRWSVVHRVWCVIHRQSPSFHPSHHRRLYDDLLHRIWNAANYKERKVCGLPCNRWHRFRGAQHHLWHCIGASMAFHAGHPLPSFFERLQTADSLDV